MTSPAKIMFAIRVERPDVVALRIVAKRSKKTPSQLIREAIKQIIRAAA